MSYDVAIWKSVKPLDGKTAVKIYQSLGETPSELLEKTPALKKLHAALMKRFPALGEDDEDACPWSAGVELGERHIVAPMSFSWAGDVVPEIQLLAAKHGLDVFDPQKKKVLPPIDPNAKVDPKKRLKADVAVPALCRELAAPMKGLGFEATKRDGVPGFVFLRKTRSRSEEIAFINIGGSDVIPHLAVRFPEVSALTGPILARWSPPRGTVAAFGRGATVAGGSVYFALDLAEPRAMVPDHEICHQECFEEAVRAIPAALETHTLPLFEELDTIAKVDAFFHQGIEKHVRGHVWAELPVSALVVAKLAGRRDLADWVAHYEKRCAKSADLETVWPSLLDAIR